MAMGQSRKSWVLLVVLAFHGLLIAALVMSSRTLQLPPLARDLLELTLLPAPPRPLAAARAAATLTAAAAGARLGLRATREATPLTVPPSSSITLPTAPAADTARALAPIDWASEAHDVAAATAASAAHPAAPSFKAGSQSDFSAPSRSLFDERPAHYAGEQLRTDDGRWVVFVNDNCYQVPDPFESPNASHNGMGLQTYCLGGSHEPRGDLFKDLPAYHTRHR